MGGRCSDRSRAAGEPISGTAATADRWLLLEVPGGWPRDVGAGDGLPESARRRVANWLAASSELRRVQFIRRPGRARGPFLAFVVRAEESTTEVRRLELASHGELEGLDLESAGEVVETQLVLVCGHGSRDACCSLRGTAVYGALAERLGDEDLWISSHQGGHRFAANVLVLPAGLQLGRVEPDEAPLVVIRALAGRIALDRYRGRTCYAAVVQAADHAVRVAGGLDRLSDLRVASVEGSLIRFREANGVEHSARVDEREGSSVPPSCGAEAEPQVLLVARVEPPAGLTVSGGTPRP